MQAVEGSAGARDKHAQLVEEGVEGVEGAIGCERSGLQREEESRGDALVDAVFGDVDEQEGEHVWEEEGACSGEVLFERGFLVWRVVRCSGGWANGSGMRCVGFGNGGRAGCEKGVGGGRGGE